MTEQEFELLSSLKDDDEMFIDDFGSFPRPNNLAIENARKWIEDLGKNNIKFDIDIDITGGIIIIYFNNKRDQIWIACANDGSITQL